MSSSSTSRSRGRGYRSRCTTSRDPSRASTSRPPRTTGPTRSPELPGASPERRSLPFRPTARSSSRRSARRTHAARLALARPHDTIAVMWVALALAAALFQVLRNTVMKRLGHALDEYINVWGRFTFLLPWALVTAAVTGWPTLKSGFYAWCLAFGTYLAASLIMTPVALTTSARHFPAVPRYWKEFVALGLFAALTTLSQGKAYTLTLSSYVEAVKQIEILFAMGVGVLFFGEAEHVRESALGALVMLAGMVLLALAR